jgi:hypothetical protein
MTSPYHRPLRVGTRGSPLALAQARQVTGQLRERCGRAPVLITMAEALLAVLRELQPASTAGGRWRRCQIAGGRECWSKAEPAHPPATLPAGASRVKRGRIASGQEANMERADWLAGGFDSAQARFLMLTAITHHRFRSLAWASVRSEGSTPSSRRSTFPRRGRSSPAAVPVPGSAVPLSGRGGRRKKLADDRCGAPTAADRPVA